MVYNQKITKEIEDLTAKCLSNLSINQALYKEYDVQRGLRNLQGEGVRAGLTRISEITSFKKVNGEKIPCDGELRYQGIDIHEITDGFLKEERFGFEEVAYLMLFGSLPTEAQLKAFQTLLGEQRTLPKNFTRDVIMKAPSKDMMNTLSRSVLTLYAYDTKADDTSLANVLRQCINLIATFPMMCVYGYHAYNHYIRDKSMYIHRPSNELSTAENILMMLREDRQYTNLEARVLDLAMVLHMEHGGGNNSTFTTHVVTSSGTDTYSAIAAALGSLKGPKHGGANLKVVEMFKDMKKNIRDINDEEEIKSYLLKLLMGHAVYSLSDPRANIFKQYVKQLAHAKHRDNDFKLYSAVERLAPEVIGAERHIYKGVSANIDFYSGFVYGMLDLPTELYTPIFACSRIVGWSAHRIEELINTDKIIRPAYMAVKEHEEYVEMKDRK